MKTFLSLLMQRRWLVRGRGVTWLGEPREHEVVFSSEA